MNYLEKADFDWMDLLNFYERPFSLKTGKTCWVKAHKVGDVTKGIVFHDYVIEAKL